MRIFPVAAGRPVLRAAALLLALATGMAAAEPGDAADPVMKLLADKGLLAEAPPAPETTPRRRADAAAPGA